MAEDRLLSSIIRNSYHVLLPLFPLPSPDGLASASALIHLPYPSNKTSNVFPVSHTEPFFLLSSPRCVFPIGSSLYTLSTTISCISISLSLHLLLLAPRQLV